MHVIFLIEGSHVLIYTQFYWILMLLLSEEVEEELDILKELAPAWISEKVASSGDVIFR